MSEPVWSLECLDFEESSYNQLPGSLSQDHKYMHARQIPANHEMLMDQRYQETR